MNIAFIRGPYLNNYELQSYYPLLEDKTIALTGFSSLHPLHPVTIPTQKFFSPVDLPHFPKKLPILNRLMGGDAMYLWGMERALKSFDIAHVRETYFHFSAQAIYAKQKGYIKKVLVTCSETIPFNHESIWGRKGLKRTVIEHADHFHCLTHKAKVALQTEGVDAGKITVIPYGIDLHRFSKSKPKHPPNKNLDLGVNVLFVGRLEEQKGIRELLEAWSQLRAHSVHATLTIVGKGPLESLVRAYGHQPQTYPYSQMPEVFAQADIVVLPSKPDAHWEEYFGMVLLEAMASNAAIVTTDCGAIAEVVGDAALISPPGNGSALARNLQALIQSPQKSAHLARRGQRRVCQFFDARTQAPKLRELYRTLA